jgi:ectoine hydroxylase-related dioxygenase (phytanoyl-CoA dioxygenase family)
MGTRVESGELKLKNNIKILFSSKMIRQYDNCVILLFEEKERDYGICMTRNEYETLVKSSSTPLQIPYFSHPILVKNPSVVLEHPKRTVFYLGDELRGERYILKPVDSPFYDKYTLEHILRSESEEFILQREIRSILEFIHQKAEKKRCESYRDTYNEELFKEKLASLSTKKLFDTIFPFSLHLRYIAIQGLILLVQENKFIPYRNLEQGFYDGFTKGWNRYKFIVDNYDSIEPEALKSQNYSNLKNLCLEISNETGIPLPSQFRTHDTPEYMVQYTNYMLDKQCGKKLLNDIYKNGYIIFRIGEQYENVAKSFGELTHTRFEETKCSPTFCLHDEGLCEKNREWTIINKGYRQLLVHPYIISIVEELYGKNKCHLTSFSTNTIPAHASDIYWHVDHPYKAETRDTRHHVPLSLQINISLDEFTEDNGATMFVPGSHRMTSEQRERAQKAGNVKTFLCPTGTVLMYFGNLWHSAGENKTDNLRSILLANFSKLQYDGLKMKNPRDIPIAEQIREDDPDFKVVDGKVLLR